MHSRCIENALLETGRGGTSTSLFEAPSRGLKKRIDLLPMLSLPILPLSVQKIAIAYCCRHCPVDQLQEAREQIAHLPAIQHAPGGFRVRRYGGWFRDSEEDPVYFVDPRRGYLLYSNLHRHWLSPRVASPVITFLSALAFPHDAVGKFTRNDWDAVQRVMGKLAEA